MIRSATFWTSLRRVAAGRPLILLLLLLLGLPSGVTMRAAEAATQAPVLPCDIYGGAGTACVAAHSTVRALFGAYNGPLYQVRRGSDGKTQDIGLLAAGGYANAAAQDTFCANTTCIFTIIYDQTSRHNHLTIEGAGQNGAADVGAPADALPITAGGHQVYGISFSGHMGYRNNATSGVAVRGQAEGMYMVTSGTHFNDQCCFDYGNAETSGNDTGNGHMDALNFGTECWFNKCYGSGPWLQGDLENGLFQSSSGGSTNTANTGNPQPYVTALMKNNGQNYWALKVGNAQTGRLTTTFSGAEPTLGGYAPMQQEGAIVLGTGGDNSNGSIGSFFEGVMTAGLPTDDADNKVQANIVTVGYGAPTGTTGSLTPGSEIALETSAPNSMTYLLANAVPAATSTGVVTASSSTAQQTAATWIVRRGFANNNCVSFEAKNYPGNFARHYNYVLYAQPYDGSTQFAQDATFCPVNGLSGQGTSFQSVNFNTRYLSAYNAKGVIAAASGDQPQDGGAAFTSNASWIVVRPLMP